MNRVVAIILHAVPEPGAGPLERSFAAARAENAATQGRGFGAAGAEVSTVETHAGDEPFSRRLRALAREHPGAGLIVLGSGSIPLARPPDHARFVASAAAVGAGRAPAVLVNNRYSSDIMAIPPGVDLEDVPDLAADNAVPRWLAGRGVAVDELRRRWRLQVDLDSPIDVLISNRGRPAGERDAGGEHALRLMAIMARIRTSAADPSAEVVVAGRTSSDTLRWLERRTASRTRALIEERGMKTAGLAQRATRSTLGLLLDRDGPDAFGNILAALSDAAVVDTRVLMAHHFGRNEAAWPGAEDRFASDLLLPDGIRDPWLRAITNAVVAAPIPILLGGHTLVGPGLRLVLGVAPP